MAASPTMVNEHAAWKAIADVHKHGAFLLAKPGGRIGIYRHERIPFGVLQDVRRYYAQIRVLLIRMVRE